METNESKFIEIFILTDLLYYLQLECSIFLCDYHLNIRESGLNNSEAILSFGVKLAISVLH